MKITIYCLGQAKDKFVKLGEEQYLKRLTPHAKINCVEIDSSKYSRLSAPELQQKEAELLLAKLNPQEFLFVLDEQGEGLSSKELAKTLQQQMLSGVSNISFAIGGAYGWDQSVLERANKILSLSKLTFTYQMARLILVEQLYRAYSIIKGHPYHK